MGGCLRLHCMILLTVTMKPTRGLCLQRSPTTICGMDLVMILDGLGGYWVQFMIVLALHVSGFIRTALFGVPRFTLLVWGV
uniref:Uncharacterized protein n=1 Tax=Arundo donax TaxID=35708 RepID=A0A0A9GEA2_ARUDO